MNSVRPYSTGNSLANFCTALYEQEYAARRLWQSQQVGRIRLRSPPNLSGRVARILEQDTSRNRTRAIETEKVADAPPLPGPYSQQRKIRTREHDCRHCGGAHWDFECPQNPYKPKPGKVYLTTPTRKDEVIELREEEIRPFKEWRAQWCETSEEREPREDQSEDTESENGQWEH